MNMLKNKEVTETVSSRVISMLDRRANGWQGTMTDLLTAITLRTRPEVFPSSASTLRRVVNQALPAIRRAGYRVSFSRTSDHERTRLVSFARVTKKQ